MPTFDSLPRTKARVDDQSHARTQAAAWAWYQHAGSSRSRCSNHVIEARATRKAVQAFGRPQPSRFKIEAELRKSEGRICAEHNARRGSVETPGECSGIVDLNRSAELISSLLDSFEVQAISKCLNDTVRREAARVRDRQSCSATSASSRNTGSKNDERKIKPACVGSNTGKSFPLQDSRHDRALFSQFRIGGPFCRSAETVSCHGAKHHVQVEKQSHTAGYTNLDANDVPLFKRRFFAGAAKKQAKFSRPATEENRELRNGKAKRVLRMISFKDVTKVLQEVNLLQQFHSGLERCHDHHHHHLHHHHHHYVQFHEESDGEHKSGAGRFI